MSLHLAIKFLTMKKLLLSLSGCLLLASASFSQTTLFQDNFQSGSSQWNLNVGSGANNWVVNSVYLGFSGFIPDTPNQPGTFTGGPQSTYMHITNTSVCGGLSVCNANFDTGAASNQNAEIATSINASTYTNITVSFWYLCAGQTGTSFGSLEYSVNGGSSWVSTGTNYVNTTSWTQETVSLPAWDNAAAFKIRFKWQNGGGGLDPAFSVDEVLIEGTSGGGGNTITSNGGIQPASWCEGMMVTNQINFTSTGTFNSGNVYTAEMSDATGSFASPTVIGTLASTANSGMITGVVPNTLPAGTGYRIRVVSDNPATIGTDNGVDLQIFGAPSVTQLPFVDVCDNAGLVNLVGGSPSGGSYSGAGVSGGMFNPSVGGVGTSTITYYYIDGNGCDGSAVEQITVIAAPTVTLASFANVCSTDPFFTLTGGSPSNGTFSGPGVTGGVFNPASAGVGTHNLVYTFTDGNGCSGTASQSIVVEQCGGINEEAFAFQLFPNPTESTFELIVAAQVNSIVLQDMSGRSLKSFDPTTNLFDVSEIPSGVYFVRIEVDGQFSQRRLVIR